MDTFGWCLVGGAWALSIWALTMALRLYKRNTEAWEQYDSMRGIAERAMARADFAFEGMVIALKYAGLEDLPGEDVSMAEAVGAEEQTDPTQGS
jgi:hypothetical protein